jgi:hypothetical protein
VSYSNWYDHAVAEAFFGTLKTECVEAMSFQSRVQARQALFEYTVCSSNRVRRHSTLGSKSPVLYEQLMCEPEASGPPSKWVSLKASPKSFMSRILPARRAENSVTFSGRKCRATGARRSKVVTTCGRMPASFT